MTDNNSSSTGAASTALFGFIFSGMGAFIILAAMNIIPISPESLHAPRWVLGAAGGMFFLAGMAVISQGIAGPGAEQIHLFQWLQYVLVLGILIGFSSVFVWVGLGSGEREFQGTSSFGPIRFSGQGDEFLGRCLFGGFGVLVSLVTLFYAINQPLKILGKDFRTSEEQKSLGDNDE